MAVTFTELQIEIGMWAEIVFAHDKKDLMPIINHLRKEIEELSDACEMKNLDGIRDEVADCVILLCSIAYLSSFSLEMAVREKHEINRHRKWGKPDENGVIEHD